ncbi:MAG: hypothetical protein KDA41_03380, partial [Planctomycetales bacterium]|nr:hypothetical protein [Planctomycetales bacterium]
MLPRMSPLPGLDLISTNIQSPLNSWGLRPRLCDGAAPRLLALLRCATLRDPQLIRHIRPTLALVAGQDRFANGDLFVP